MKNASNECMTIVVPVFNRPVLVKRCLDSINSQTYRPLHLIVVDNASTDNTPDVLEDWKRRNERDDFQVTVLSETVKGASYARQKGLDSCPTDKVMFLDSDDAMRVDCVATVMDVWKENPDADVVAWRVARHINGKQCLTHSVKGNLLERHLVHSIFLTVGYAAKTSCLRSVGGWKGEFPVWDDLEFGTRILLSSPRVVAIKNPLVDVYPQVESITGINFSGKVGLWEKSLGGMDESILMSGRSDIARLLNIVAYRRAILAADYAKENRFDLARPLYAKALSQVSAKKKMFIRFAYHWTRLGMRGAFSIIGSFL